MQPKFIEHISLIVKNIKQTEEFYSKFLSEPIIRNENMISYKIGDTRLSFKISPKGMVSSVYDKDDIGMNHIGFGVNTLDELKEFQKFLSGVGVKSSDIKLGKSGSEYIWFDDPNGIRLEIYRN